MTDTPAPRTHEPESASLLRHDLIDPVNQILGYSDLLVYDADHQGLSSRAERLRSIRDLGRRALESIDDALIREPGPVPGRPPDLRSLADGVARLSEAIGEACQTLEVDSGQVPDRASFLEDLGRIRDAAATLSAMVRKASADGDGAC